MASGVVFLPWGGRESHLDDLVGCLEGALPAGGASPKRLRSKPVARDSGPLQLRQRYVEKLAFCAVWLVRPGPEFVGSHLLLSRKAPDALSARCASDLLVFTRCDSAFRTDFSSKRPESGRRKDCVLLLCLRCRLFRNSATRRSDIDIAAQATRRFAARKL